MTVTVTSGLMEALSALHDATVNDEAAHARAHDALLQATSDHGEAAQHEAVARWRPGWGKRNGKPLHDAHTEPPVPLDVEIGRMLNRTYRPHYEPHVEDLATAQQIITRVREHDGTGTDGVTLLPVSAGDRDHLRTALSAWIDRLDVTPAAQDLRRELITLCDRVSGQRYHEDETDCPDPANCRAHRGILA